MARTKGTHARPISTITVIVEGKEYKVTKSTAEKWKALSATKKEQVLPITTDLYHLWSRLIGENAMIAIPYSEALEVVKVMKPKYDEWIIYTYLTNENDPERFQWYEKVGYLIRSQGLEFPYNTEILHGLTRDVPAFYGDFGLTRDPVYKSKYDKEALLRVQPLNQLTGIVHNAYIRYRRSGEDEILPEYPLKFIDWGDLVMTAMPRVIINNYNVSGDILIDDIIDLYKLRKEIPLEMLASEERTISSTANELHEIDIARSAIASFTDVAFAWYNHQEEEEYEYDYKLLELEKYPWSPDIPRQLLVGIVVTPDSRKRYENLSDNDFMFSYSAILNFVIDSSNISTQQKLDYLGLSHLIGRKEEIAVEEIGRGPYIISPSLLVYDVNTTYLSNIGEALRVIGEDNMYTIAYFLVTIADQEEDREALRVATEINEILQ